MPRFYKGVGVGTFLHRFDLRTRGIAPQNPGSVFNVHTVSHHIARATTTTPCISLTRSFGVGRSYALGGRVRPTSRRPAHVYEIDIPDPPPSGMQVIDPIQVMMAANGNPLSSVYQHDGPPDFLLGVVSPSLMKAHLAAPTPQPPGSGGTPRPPNLSIELEAMVRALRDAEVIVVGNLPASCVINRFDIF